MSVGAALAGPLKALTHYPQFVAYGTEPLPGGKTRKFPCDPRTGRPVDGQDPANWMAAEQALATGRPVGFVFTEADPFFFLDIDGALQPDGAWSPLAVQLYQRFAGCGYEVSQSGKGMHLFGTGACPPHSVKNTALGLELYTSRRFVALTGAGATGDAGHDATAALALTVAEHFPPVAQAGRSTHDGAGPRADWSGPTDDAELVALIQSSTHALPVFGGGPPNPTDAQLWDGDVDVIAARFPEHDEKDRPFDASDAGWEFARVLAYWTGCDVERMERLMLASPFYAVAGWDERRALVAVRKRAAEWKAEWRVYSAAPAALDTESAPAGPAPKRGEFLDGEGQAALFRGHTYVASMHAVMAPTGVFYGPGEFKAHFGGHWFRMDASNEKTSRDAFEAFTQSALIQSRKVDTLYFNPRDAFGAIRERHGVREVNTYRPKGCERVAGDVTPFLTRYEKIVPDERDRRILFSWVAAAVQSPGVKFQWALVLQSEAEALGKSLLGQVLRNALGNDYFHPLTQKERKTDAFSGWKFRKLAVLVDEITRAETRGDNEGMWKDLITSDFQGVEAKGVDARMEEVFYNLIFTTNERGVFRLSDASRRFAVFHYAIQNDEEKRAAGLDDDGFTDWMKSGGMERVVAWFDAYPVDPEFDPRTVITAPRTSSWEDAVAESRDALCSVMEEAIEANNRPGLMRGWVSGRAAADALHEARYKVTPQAVARILKQLGYEPHPGLRKNGRTAHRTETDGAEVRLFIQRGHPSAYMEGAAAEQQYDADQKL